LSLARDADLLLHDCQYTDAEYPGHIGWGHSAVTHTLQFARRVGARHTLLFHHDPLHTDDQLDVMLDKARVQWAAHGGEQSAISMAAEGLRLSVGESTTALMP
jgi:ribonuclease BN (tRNA processing enzyme)